MLDPISLFHDAERRRNFLHYDVAELRATLSHSFQIVFFAANSNMRTNLSQNYIDATFVTMTRMGNLDSASMLRVAMLA